MLHEVNIDPHMPSKFILTVLMLLAGFAVPTASAQKVYKPVKSALKDKKYAEAVKQVDNLRKDSVLKDEPQLAIFSIEAQRGLNDAENMKLYLKRSYDTLALFSTTLQIVKESVRLDSIERAREANGSGKRKNRRFVLEHINRYFPNLHAASRFLYAHGKFAEAMPYFETCIKLPHTAIGQEARLQQRAEAQNAALYLTSAYNSRQFNLVCRYDSLALTDSASRMGVMQCLALTAEAQTDTAAQHLWLDRGWKEFPREEFFFVRLADFHMQRHAYGEVVSISQRQLQTDSLSIPALLALCNASFHLENFTLCTSTAERLIAADSTNAEAYYYAGASQAALANSVILPDNINSSAYRKALQQKRAYALKAEPWLEQFRALAPNEQQRWAPLLYQVYLTLNRGSKFAEIDKIINKG